LEDLTSGQVADLNYRYGSPLRTRRELTDYYGLVGGHPYLVRRGCTRWCGGRWNLKTLVEQADQDDASSRAFALFAGADCGEPELCQAVREVLRQAAVVRPPAGGAFLPARTAGILAGPRSAMPPPLPAVRALPRTAPAYRGQSE